MATDIGHTSLTQVDIDKFYIPQGHVDKEEFQQQVLVQWKRVLENTEQFMVEARKADPNVVTTAVTKDAAPK